MILLAVILLSCLFFAVRSISSTAFNESSTANYLVRDPQAILALPSLSPLEHNDDNNYPMFSDSDRILGFLYNGNLWTVNESATSYHQLTYTGAVTAYDWSPDGQRIAYVSHEGSSSQTGNTDGDI